ncbi:MAG: hypothetical protein LBT00_08415 [Spirochaetaceae bacterium]|jgi:hypothetical protein|nr:hypothetical protein [Spirochaetaceae bacterium]
MLFLLVSSALCLLLLAGFGCLFGRLAGFAPRNPWLYVWLGIFAAGTLAMLASLFVPLNMVALVVFAVLGGLGVPSWCRAYIRSAGLPGDCGLRAVSVGTQTARPGLAETKIFGLSAFLFFFAFICLFAYVSFRGAYDTDLYHAQIIRWYNEYGTAPGVGNLHERLAFNSLWHALAALFDNGVWDNRSEWLMPCIMLSGGVFYFLHELCFEKQNAARVYALCLLVWLGLTARGLIRSGPTLYYDDPPMILNAIVVLEAYLLIIGDSHFKTANINKTLALILVLAATAFLIKPSGAITVVGSGLLALFLLVRSKRPVTDWLRVFAPAFCAFCVWVAKNIFLSGYPLYPVPIFALPLDWTMPFENANGNYQAVVGWARMPGPAYLQSLENGFLFWFVPWLKRQYSSISLSVVPACVVWILVMRHKYSKRALFFLLWTTLTIVYWFVTAPNQRFGHGFFWTLLAAALMSAVPETPRFDLKAVWKYAAVREAFFIVWTLGIVSALTMNIARDRYSVWSIGTTPARPVKEYTVNASHPFGIWVPADEKDDRTGNSPLPSTPYPSDRLEMRVPGDLGKGFRPQQP